MSTPRTSTLGLTLVVTIALLPLSAQAAAVDGLNLLGNQAQQVVVPSTTGGIGGSTQQITGIIGPNGLQPANLTVLNQNGQSYVQPSAFSQLYPGVNVANSGNVYRFRQQNGADLFIQILQTIVILFAGQQIDTGLSATQSNGQTFLPTALSALFGNQFTQQGNNLVSSNTGVPSWLQQSWNTTLQQNGGTQYLGQVGQAAQAPGNGQVFRDIVATVFSSVESGQRGAYGEYLTESDIYVALPYRFSGTRPKVAVQGPNGQTVVAPIKDVGPWNIRDPYWMTGSRPQAETGTDNTGRRTNLAGIDLSPALGRAVGINGKGKVNWWFVQ